MSSLLIWVPLPHVPEHDVQLDQPDQVPLTISQIKTSFKDIFHLKNILGLPLITVFEEEEK